MRSFAFEGRQATLAQWTLRNQSAEYARLHVTLSRPFTDTASPPRPLSSMFSCFCQQHLSVILIEEDKMAEFAPECAGLERTDSAVSEDSQTAEE